MSLIHNERTKLRATALNGGAIAPVAAGFITPIAAVAFGVTGAAGRGTFAAAGAALAFHGVGMSPHILATRILGRLIE